MIKQKLVLIVGIKIRRKQDILTRRKIYASIWIFLLFLLNLYIYNFIENFSYSEAIFYSLINTILYTFINMLAPFFYRIFNKDLIDYEKGKKICLWNDIIIIFLISFFRKLTISRAYTIYYFINMWIFVKPPIKEYLLSKENVSKKICYYINKGTDSIYKILKEENYNIDNQDNYFFNYLSNIYHLYFYKLSLSAYYSRDDIEFIVNDCINKIISSITNDLKEKIELLDIFNDIFNNLDLHDKNSNEMFPAKFFISSLEDCSINEIKNSSLLSKLSTYFSSLLEDKIYEL